MWESAAYLTGREPLPVNVNVASTCFSHSSADPLERAAIIVCRDGWAVGG